MVNDVWCGESIVNIMIVMDVAITHCLHHHLHQHSHLHHHLHHHYFLVIS